MTLKYTLGALIIPVVAASLCVAQSTAQLGEKKVLTIAVAKQVAAAALAVATANHYLVTVTIADDSGRPLYVERMDGANPSSTDTSGDKAISAALYKQPTKNFADRLAGGETLVLKLKGVMPVEGGFPLIVDGKVIGAIGVGGAPQGQLDAKAAQAGVDWLAQHVK